MKTNLRTYLVTLSIPLFTIAMAQDNIPVTTLSLHADMWPATISGGFKQSIISFGNYQTTGGKKGPEKTRQKGNLLGTKSQSTITQKISFKISDGSASVLVHLTKNAKINESHEFPVGKNFSLGEEKVTSFYDSLNANIEMDSATHWKLQMDLAKVAIPFEEAGLLNNEAGKQIRVTAMQSEVSGKKMFPLPARGFLFTADGDEVAAVQIMGSGISGPMKKLVWMKKDLRPELKIALSATMAAILIATQDYLVK